MSVGPPAGSPAGGELGAAVSENQIYQRMVAAILDQRLPPGTKLVEDRLAAAFGVSRTRIRPVLVRLANEQVLTLTPNRGASVAQPTKQEAREVFEVRRMIEPTLLRCFIQRAGPADTAALAQCIADEEAAHAAGDHHRAIRLAGDFHLQIAQMAQHHTLGRILRELVSRTSLVLMAYGSKGPSLNPHACSCQEHRGLLAAIQAGNGDLAARLVHEHLLALENQLRFEPPKSEAPDLAGLFGVPGR